MQWIDMKLLCIDFETTKVPRHLPWIRGSYPVILGAVAVDTNNIQPSANKVWCLNHPENKSDLPMIYTILQIQQAIDYADIIVAHNFKFELAWLTALGIDMSSVNIHCTQIAEYLLMGQLGDVEGEKKGLLKLDTLAQKYGLGRKLDEVAKYWEEGKETDEVPLDVLEEYCLMDCQLTLQIAERQIEMLAQQGLQHLAWLQFDTTKIMSDIESNGMLMDRRRLCDLNDEYEEKLYVVEEELTEILPFTVHNLYSDEQKSAMLYGGSYTTEGTEEVERQLKGGRIKRYTRKCKVKVDLPGLGFKPPQRSDTSKEGVWKTDKDTLKQLRPTNDMQKEVLAKLLELSVLSKQKSTYFQGFLDKLDEENMIHPSMNQTITTTGRLSSSNPNGQNIPRGSTSPAKEPFITRY